MAERLGKQVSCSDLKKKPNPDAAPPPESKAEPEKQVQEDKKGVANDKTSSIQPTPVGRTISCSDMKQKTTPTAQPELKQDNKDVKEDKKEEGNEKAKKEAESCPSNKKNINKK